MLELVKSDIYLVRKNESLAKPKDKYLNIDLSKLIELRELLVDYMLLLYPDDDYNYEEEIT